MVDSCIGLTRGRWGFWKYSFAVNQSNQIIFVSQLLQKIIPVWGPLIYQCLGVWSPLIETLNNVEYCLRVYTAWTTQTSFGVGSNSLSWQFLHRCWRRLGFMTTLILLNFLLCSFDPLPKHTGISLPFIFLKNEPRSRSSTESHNFNWNSHITDHWRQITCLPGAWVLVDDVAGD